MSINKGIIKKYTQALFKVVVKENDINQVSDRLHNIRSILKSIPELKQLLITRRVQVQDKMNILKNILGDKISNIVMDLMVLLMENGHMMLFGEVVKRFDYLLDKESKLVKVHITSSSILSDDEVERISLKIENNIQKEVEVKTEIDSSIMGGIKLRVGNTLIDGSIHSRLQKMRDTLIQV
jgi:F-type H+-transporting ATPase subunit delta